jgi:hypothetical protein
MASAPTPQVLAAVLLIALLPVVAPLPGCYRESIESTAPDVIAPLPPAGLRLESAHDGYVFISWMENSEQDLQAYVVYRSEPSAAGFTAIDTTTRDWYVDGQRSYDTTYTYRVTALDNSGNESAPSGAVSAQSPNTSPPAAPSLLNVAASNIGGALRIEGDWNPVDAYDLRGYVVLRARSADPAGFDTLLATDDTRFVDTSIAATGVVYYYAVAAVDRGGLAGARSPVASDLATDAPRLLAPADASKVTDYPVFQWAATPGALAYRLLLCASPAGDQVWTTTVDETGAASYTVDYAGPSLATAKTYYWRVATLSRPGGPINAASATWTFQTNF